jgi:regulator of replication initiation timing
MQQKAADDFLLFEQRLKQLIQSHQVLRSDLEALREEMASVLHQNELLREENNHFRNREKMNNIVTSLTERNTESEQLKSKLDGYLRVIDKCIKHINNT